MHVPLHPFISPHLATRLPFDVRPAQRRLGLEPQRYGHKLSFRDQRNIRTYGSEAAKVQSHPPHTHTHRQRKLLPIFSCSADSCPQSFGCGRLIFLLLPTFFGVFACVLARSVLSLRSLLSHGLLSLFWLRLVIVFSLFGFEPCHRMPDEDSSPQRPGSM